MKQFNFDFEDVRLQFLKFLQSLDVQPYDQHDIFFDGTLHRYRIHDEKQGHKSGAYLVHTDGWPAGYVQDWRTGLKENWKYDASTLNDEQRKYFNSDEFKKKAEEEHRKAEEKRRKKRANQSERARIFFDTLKQAPDDHPYLLHKNVKPYGIAYNHASKCLAVPLRDISGKLLSIQWITEDGQKLFFEGAELKGALFSIDMFTIDNNYEGIILIGEGVATMLKVYDLTGYPCAAVMSCFRLEELAAIIHKNYPLAKIIITADNDWKTAQKRGQNPGLFYAGGVCKKKLAAGYVFPEFKPHEEGTDWDDYALIHGDKMAADVLAHDIQQVLIPPNIKNLILNQKLVSINAQELRNKTFMPIKWAVPGLIPSGLSILGGGPKVGKSIFALNIAVGIAIGGCVLGKINVTQGDVLYLALEDNQRRLQERLDSIVPDEVTSISRLTLTTVVPRQHEGGNEYLNWWLNEHKEAARLVIIDTLQKYRKQQSGKANVYAEDYDTISELKRIADYHDVAVLIIHHLKKMGTKEDIQSEISGDWINTFSGSAGLSGSADALFIIKRDRGCNTGRMYRTGRDVEEKQFTLRLDGFGWFLNDEAEDFILPTWKKQVVYFLKEHGTVTPKELAAGYDLDPKTAQKNLQRMEKEGIIRKTSRGQYELNPVYNSK